MYGPAVRCKWILPSWRGAVLHQCIRPLIGACCAPGHHGYQRACDLISGKASSGPFGSSVLACAGKTEPPSRLILSQTSAAPLMRDTWIEAVFAFQDKERSKGLLNWEVNQAVPIGFGVLYFGRGSRVAGLGR